MTVWQAVSAWQAMPSWVVFLLSGVCHQIPEHSFWIDGQVLPLCARCTGQFGGALLAIVALVVAGRYRRSLFAPWWAQGVMAALAAWWALDGVNSFLYGLLGRPWLYEPMNGLRLITGLGLGLVAGVELLPAVALSIVRQPERRPIIDRPIEILVLLGGLMLAGAIGLSGRLPYLLAAAWPALGVAALLGGANGLLLVLVTGATPESLSRGRLGAFALGGLGLGLLEAGALATLRRLIGV